MFSDEATLLLYGFSGAIHVKRLKMVRSCYSCDFLGVSGQWNRFNVSNYSVIRVLALDVSSVAAANVEAERRRW
jgi:hypothetical protein